MKGFNVLKFCSLVLSVLLLMSTFALASCDDADPDRFDDLYNAISEYYDLQTDTDAPKEEELKYIIVIPSKCSAAILDGAEMLSEVILRYTGYAPEVLYDSDVSYKKSVPEIVISRTDRDESLKYYKKLRIGEYGYEYTQSGSFAIGGQTEESCLLAIDCFANGIRNGDIDLKKPQLVKPYKLDCEYDISEIKINGFELCEYSIVYPANDTLSEKALALILRDRIAEYGAYCLDVISDKEATESTRAICVGHTALSSLEKENVAENTVSLIIGKSDVEMIADSNAGIHFAIERFMEKLKDSESEGVCELLHSDKIETYEYDSKPFDVFSVGDHLGGATLNIYVNTVKGINSADISLFRSLGAGVITNIRNNGIILTHLDNNVFYSSDRNDVECLSAELKKTDGGYVASLELKLRYNSERVAVICARTGGACDSDAMLEAIAFECERFSDIPTVVMHDLSARLCADLESSGSCQKLVRASYDGNVSVYYTDKSLRIVDGKYYKIDHDLGGEIFKFELYYT